MSVFNRYMTVPAAILVLMLPAVGQTEPVVRVFDVTPGGELEVDTDAGSIEVTSADVTRVTVEVDLRAAGAEDFELDFHERADGVEVTGKARRGLMSGRRNDVDVNYTIQVPRRYDVDLRTSGGRISVGDLDGRVRASTSGGSIDVGRIAGEVEASTSGGGITVGFGGGDVSADTSGGSIRVEEAAGRINADTSGGSIRIGSAAGPVDVDTSGGSIKVEAARAAVSASTSGGSIKVGFAAQPDGKSRLNTSGGTVTVYLADGVAVDVRARSGVGVSSKLQLDDARAEPGRLEGRLNGGGPLLDLKSSGRVRIESM